MRGLVTVARTSKGTATPARIESRIDKDAQHELLNAFPDLRGAIVVETPGHGDAADGILVHRLLGQAMADHIANGAVLRDNESLAVGSGRAVYYSVEALGKAPPLRVSNVTLVSLTGSLHVRGFSDQLNLHMDSDIHLSFLGQAFAQKVTLEQIGHPLSVASHSDRDAVLAHTWLGTWKTTNPLVPRHALVGVGVLGENHRLYDLALRADQDAFASRFDPTLPKHLNPHLRELVSICRRYAEKGLQIAGDLSNLLFWVESPGDSVSGSDAAEAKAHIAALNQQLVTADAAVYSSIENIMVVSGTVAKASAIYSLLMERSLPGVKLSFLCTDTATARRLVFLKRRGA